jgi:hypothetical protein
VDFEKAVVFEKKLQEKIALVTRMTGVPYFHNSLKPLGEIDFSEDKTQGNFHFHNECEGMCGV